MMSPFSSPRSMKRTPLTRISTLSCSMGKLFSSIAGKARHHLLVAVTLRGLHALEPQHLGAAAPVQKLSEVAFFLDFLLIAQFRLGQKTGHVLALGQFVVSAVDLAHLEVGRHLVEDPDTPEHSLQALDAPEA